eukprot:TRINITY_DN65934_c0_g1_i1.p1 TRINITY_DN65934_c0_g1~~TRINITY_DN65934_c0_g1_i1.p1  ORF type:complete len:125 (+),score=36.30 TRINITY_DN65934_c0_g1_i1:215-589(+)
MAPLMFQEEKIEGHSSDEETAVPSYREEDSSVSDDDSVQDDIDVAAWGSLGSRVFKRLSDLEEEDAITGEPVVVNVTQWGSIGSRLFQRLSDVDDDEEWEDFSAPTQAHMYDYDLPEPEAEMCP